MLPRERQEPVDDGDGRVGQIVRIARATQPQARPRLAWRPWLRGFVLGTVLGGVLGAAVALRWVRHEVERVTDTLNKISHFDHERRTDGGIQGDQEEHRGSGLRTQR